MKFLLFKTLITNNYKREMPRNRSHEIAEYLSDGYHSEGGEGYGSLTQAYSRAYGRLKRAERAKAAMNANATVEKKL
jgi:hypothetical protein